jgi:biopolymer transport protein ExbB
MSNLFSLLARGGPVMIPMAACSILTISCALERSKFWINLLSRESRIVHAVLDAARRDLNEAAMIASQHRETPIGRYLLTPLSLNNASPDTFRLALEAAAEKEFVKMRKGDKLLETIVGVAPLLGLLGTVTGLIATFYNLNIGGGGSGTDISVAADGIGEALITTAAGMVVAIVALIILRVLVTLQSQQSDYFIDAGNDLELIYRQYWYEPALLAAENGQVQVVPNLAIDPKIASLPR